jgi:small subunit ribosomal protein S3Ae
MAKARSRAAARKIKDRWKAKSWYNIVAPPAFDSVTIADTLADNPDNLINRVTGVSLQDLTNDFRKSHVTLYFKIHKVEENTAMTQYVGHTLTSDYLRRMIRRRKSKIDGIYDVSTRDGAVMRVKPFATTDKRIQNSQKRIVREAMKSAISEQASKLTLTEFVKNIIDGKVGSDIYKNCKTLYPVKRVEVYKTEVISQPTIKIEDKKPKKKEEKPEEAEDKPKEKKPKKEKKDEEVKQPKTKDEKTDEEKEDKEPEEKEEKPKKKAKAKKSTTKKKTTKKKK